MRVHLQTFCACALLLGPSVASRASAQEEPPPAATTTLRPPVARFDDETPVSHVPVRLDGPTYARTEPTRTGQLVARLPHGKYATRIALRGGAALIEFDDPGDPSTRLAGWVPIDALPASARTAGWGPSNALASSGAEVTAAGPLRTWYGWQTLTTDGAAVTVAVTGLMSGSSPVFVAGLFLGAATNLLGAPIVHWAHGNVGAGFGSLGLRLLCGSVGVLSVAAAAFSGSLLFAIGAPAILVPLIVDPAVLAYDMTPDAAPKQTSLLPLVTPTKDGASFGVAGSF